MKKTKIIKSTIHHILILIVLIAALLSSNVFALNFLKGNLAKTPENETPEITIRNLAMGIETGNLGVRRSCIYFAGLYEIEKLVEPLVAQLTKEPDPNTRIFIAFSLYKIGTKAAIKAVEDLAKNEVFALNFFKGNLAKTRESETPDITIRNLAMGIETGNLGVRRSCIYFAGLYEIEKLVEPLVAQLTKEPDPNTRIFIALSLYKIGTKAAIIAVEDLVMNDVNPRVNK